MPRRKKTVFDNVPSGAIFPEPLRRSVLQVVGGQPPASLSLLATTPEQAMKLRSERYFFRCIGAALDAFFSGDRPPDFSEMPKHQKEEIGLYVSRFVSFFVMVSSNWESVEKALSSTQRKEITIGGNGIKLKIPAGASQHVRTPGEALMSAISYSSIGRLEVAFGIAEQPTGYEVRKAISDSRKARRNKAKSHQKEAAISRMVNLVENHPSHAFEAVCYVASLGGGTAPGSRDTRRYSDALADIEVFINKIHHPRSRSA
ncbi:MAG: hypothetical protein WA949_12895 [Phormidesmis sp.]